MNLIRPSNIYNQSLVALAITLSLCGAIYAEDGGGSAAIFPSDTVVVPAKYSRGNAGVSRLILIDPGGSPSGLMNTTRQSDDSLPVQVFRVQLYTSKLYGDAARMSRIGRELCLAPVTVDYDVPYYKVRSGTFATRSEAETYVSRTKTLGFTEAWVVVAANPLRKINPVESNSGEAVNNEAEGQ
ncbi:MAG: SPOR domain-containing protein [Candidatus Zixiibacteriota bacterium]